MESSIAMVLDVDKPDIWFAPALRLLWKHAPDALVVANSRREIVLVNPAFTAMFGYTLEEVRGRTTELFYESPAEYERQGRVRFNTKLGEYNQPYEQFYRRKTGELFPTETFAHALRVDSGELIAYVSHIRDITPRRQAENTIVEANRFLDSIVENIPDMIFVKDAEELRFVRFNRAGESLLGLSRHNLLGKNDYDFFPKSEADFFVARDREVLKSKRLLDIPEEPIHTKNGLRQLHTKKIPICDTNGTPKYLLGISEDITEKLKVEKLKEDFVSTVSHELRTPLTSIRGALGLIRSGSLGETNEQIHSLVEIAYKNCERLALLINDILDIEKMASGHMSMDKQLHPLRRLLTDAVAFHQGIAQEYSVKFQIHEPIPDVEIAIDYQRFMQAIGNLLSNAAKFSHANDSVEIAAELADPEHIKLAIIDHGPGIPPEFRAKIFQKFSQADSSTTRKRGGTGLGLSITKAIVEQMGGTIDYHSSLGHGAEFFCIFPIAVLRK